MFFDILVPMSFIFIGLVLGWVMHALHRSAWAINAISNQEVPSIPATQPTVPADAPEIVETVSPSKVTAVTQRIRSFAARLAERIDSHQTQIEAVSSALNATDLSTMSPVVLDAVDQLLSANELMRGELEDTQQRLREQTIELQTATQRAQTDSRTGLANRRTFDEQLVQRHSAGSQEAGVLVLADIDHFKLFNDTHGHRCGDEVLRSVARMLEARLEPYGTVARFGGEEFVALIQKDHFDEAIKLIEKTRQAIGKREIRFEGQRLKVSLSIGMGRLGELESGQQQSSDQWLQRVDDALYRSKDVGRDCTHYVDGKRFVRVGRAKEEHPIEVPVASETLPSHAGDSLGEVAGADQPIASKQSPVQSDPAHEATKLQETIARLTQQLTSAELTKPPKGLTYLPSLDAMIDAVAEKMPTQVDSTRPIHLMVLTLSGNPSGATMRGLLQIVRAALRSQDRVGCLNHSTLLVCLSECDRAEVLERAEQICHSAGSVGVHLASAERTSDGERLSVGIVQLDTGSEEGARLHPAAESIEDAILQARVTALRAAQQSAKEVPMPILTHVATIRANEMAY